MTIKTEVLKPFPVSFDGKCHAWKHDAFLMYERIGKDILMMSENSNDEKLKYFILVDELTGERVKITIE